MAQLNSTDVVTFTFKDHLMPVSCVHLGFDFEQSFRNASDSPRTDSTEVNGNVVCRSPTVSISEGNWYASGRSSRVINGKVSRMPAAAQDWLVSKSVRPAKKILW